MTEVDSSPPSSPTSPFTRSYTPAQPSLDNKNSAGCENGNSLAGQPDNLQQRKPPGRLELFKSLSSVQFNRVQCSGVQLFLCPGRELGE